MKTDSTSYIIIWSLEERRNRADLIELFKMIHGFTDAPLPAVLQITTDSCTRGHDKKLTKHCHTDSRLYFFSARVINRLEQLDTNNGRCNVSERVQETFGRSASEEDGFLYGRVVCITLLAAGSSMRYHKMTFLMIAIGAAIPGAITRCDGLWISRVFFYISIRLPLLKKWLQLTAWLFNEFKCCCKYCPVLYSVEGSYTERSKQKCNGPTRWSASSRICPNTLNVLLQLVSIVWISRTLKEEMVRILDAIVSFMTSSRLGPYDTGAHARLYHSATASRSWLQHSYCLEI